MKYLIRAGKLAFDKYLPEYDYLVNTYGSNSGNLLYTYSVEKSLTNSDTVFFPIGYNFKENIKHIQYYNSNYDAFILPLANAFRHNFISQLLDITNFIEKLSIPTVVIGIGLQVDDINKIDFDKHEMDIIRKFCSVVLDKSNKIGVRGGVTQDFLIKNVGISDNRITVIGCPSLYMFGDNIKFKTPIPLYNCISYILSYTNGLPAKIQQIFLKLLRDFPNYQYIAQRRDEQGYILDLSPNKLNNEFICISSSGNSIPFIENKVRMFTDVLSWINFCNTHSFHVGTRLHGCIASMLSGIPSCIVSHDLRIKELCEYFLIPHVDLNQFKDYTQLFDLIYNFDSIKFNKRLKENYKIYIDFLKDNKLKTIYEDNLMYQYWSKKEIYSFSDLSSKIIEYSNIKERSRVHSNISNSKSTYINNLKKSRGS